MLGNEQGIQTGQLSAAAQHRAAQTHRCVWVSLVYTLKMFPNIGATSPTPLSWIELTMGGSSRVQQQQLPNGPDRY